MQNVNGMYNEANNLTTEKYDSRLNDNKTEHPNLPTSTFSNLNMGNNWFRLCLKNIPPSLWMATVVSYESCFIQLLRHILHFDAIYFLNNIQEMKLQNIAFLQ